MSKQPCVWVVEHMWINTWDAVYGLLRESRRGSESEMRTLENNNPDEQYRVAKYVRVEPKKKKGRK